MDPIENAAEMPETQEKPVSAFRTVPDERAMPMPAQDLERWEGQSRERQSPPHPSTRFRRCLIVLATFVITAAASSEMYNVMNVRGLTTLQVALLVAFTLNFVWIALPFVSGVAGFAVLLRGRSANGLVIPPSQPTPMLTTRTALLMPIYNEEPHRIFASMQAIYESLEAIGALESFDFFILSDTTEPQVWLDEEAAFWQLRQRTEGDERIFYRHRAKNIRRKAGNIADFCRRWGAYYDHMIVLDADSLMTGEVLVRLSAAMQANPDAGVIQTLPLVVKRNTLFARAQQFAARIYGPVIAAGLAYWHLGDSSYWGHNAIIRTKAFMDHAGLPDLPGAPPFGGMIMSHDFVEAALMRRAGWKIYLTPELRGSYEESPPSLLDVAERDRRWCQGNLQHSRIVPARGLHWLSRLHLMMGIMSYVASPIWLIFIVLGFLLALQAHFIRPEYFTESFALFPTWPVFDPERAVRLFVLTMGVLLAPKFFGYVILCKDRQTVRLCGGRLRAGLSVILETILSTLMAPMTMLMQTAAVVGIMTGRYGGWNAQRRDDGSIPLRVVVRRHLVHTLLGVFLAAAAYAVSPPFLAWLSPVVIGLLLSIPVSAAVGRQDLGQAARRLGLLVTPEETVPPPILQRANELSHELTEKHRRRTVDVFERLVRDPDLYDLHMTMVFPQPKRRKGEFDADLLMGLAKLSDVDSLKEASELLSNREKLMVLHDWAGLNRLRELVNA
jgi:membrane glycosyltransferase